MINFNLTNELNEKLKEETKKIITNYKIAHEKFDERQLAEALRQALLAGDFTKYIREGDFAQQIVYLPYQEVDRLRSENYRLRELLKENNINYEYNPT